MVWRHHSSPAVGPWLECDKQFETAPRSVDPHTFLKTQPCQFNHAISHPLPQVSQEFSALNVRCLHGFTLLQSVLRTWTFEIYFEVEATAWKALWIGTPSYWASVTVSFYNPLSISSNPCSCLPVISQTFSDELLHVCVSAPCGRKSTMPRTHIRVLHLSLPNVGEASQLHKRRCNPYSSNTSQYRIDGLQDLSRLIPTLQWPFWGFFCWTFRSWKPNQDSLREKKLSTLIPVGTNILSTD